MQIENHTKIALLSSIEVHGKCDISGVYNLFPHLKKITIMRHLVNLRNDGWLVIRKSRMEDGYRINRINVRRSKKRMYEQMKLITE